MKFTLPLYFDKLQDVIFARMVERVGNGRKILQKLPNVTSNRF